MSNTPYPTALDRPDFLEVFGSIYEHSEWVADAVYAEITPGMPTDLVAKIMASIVDAAGTDSQLTLLRAHPDLAGRLSLAELTDASREEQTGAGLDQCTPEELAEFQTLNHEYLERFEFPFIFAVKGFHRTDILEAFRVRVNHTREEEFKMALAQVHRIARLRLEAIADAH